MGVDGRPCDREKEDDVRGQTFIFAERDMPRMALLPYTEPDGQGGEKEMCVFRWDGSGMANKKCYNGPAVAMSDVKAALGVKAKKAEAEAKKAEEQITEKRKRQPTKK